MAKLSVTKQSTDTITFPRRPAYGDEGTAVTLWANYFTMDVKVKPMFKYSFDIKEHDSSTPKAGGPAKAAGPGGDPPRPLAPRLVRIVIELALKKLEPVPLATEYRNQLVTLQRLKLPADDVVEVETSGGRPRTYLVRFIGPDSINLVGLYDWLNSMKDPADISDQVFPKFPEAIDALGVILGHTPRSDRTVAAIGKSRFFPLNRAEEMDTLEDDFIQSIKSIKSIFRGYVQSVRPATGRLLLNAQITHGIFRSPGNLGDLLRKFNLAQMYRVVGMQTAERNTYFSELFNFSKFLSRTRVRYQTRDSNGAIVTEERPMESLAMQRDLAVSENPPRFRFAFGSGDSVQFFLRTTNNTTWARGKAPLQPNTYVLVSDYYDRRYDIAMDLSLPLVNVGDRKRPIYVPAEKCDIVAGQPVKGKLTPTEAQKMIKFACRSPYHNAESLTTLGRTVLSLDSNPLLKHFGISVGNQLITVHGRVLKSPQVVYRQGRGEGKLPVNTNDGNWNMRNVRVIRAGRQIRKWMWIYIPHNGPNNSQVIGEVGQAVTAFVAFMKSMGININDVPCRKELIISNTNSPLKQISSELDKLDTKPDLAIVVLPKSQDASVYNAVKYLADTKYGFHTVCTVYSKLTMRNYGGQFSPQYFANVALKVNLKFGGANHQLSEEMDLLKEGKTMFVGYDVIHPTNLPTKDKEEAIPPSQVGLVISIDRQLAQWPAESWNQASRQEMLDDEAKTLQHKFQGRLRLWQKHNKTLPEYIIIFRDGVSEGQYSQVIQIELTQIRAACNQTYGPKAKQPRITVVVSVKRHHTRFYPTSDKAEDRTTTNNIKNGTVVDRGVTLARYWDFFLTAHKALQGGWMDTVCLGCRPMADE